MKTTKINIFSENIFPNWDVDEKYFLDIAKKILKFYLSQVQEQSCLNGFNFDKIVSFAVIHSTKGINPIP